MIDVSALAINLLWYLDANAALPTAGLATVYQERRTAWSAVLQKDLGWLLNNGNPYLQP